MIRIGLLSTKGIRIYFFLFKHQNPQLRVICKYVVLGDVPYAFGWDIAQHFEAADRHLMQMLNSPKKELKQYIIDYLSDLLREFQDFDKKVAAQRGAAYEPAKRLIVNMNGLAIFNETLQYNALKEGFGWSDEYLRIFKALILEVKFMWRKIEKHFNAYKF